MLIEIKISLTCRALGTAEEVQHRPLSRLRLQLFNSRVSFRSSQQQLAASSTRTTLGKVFPEAQRKLEHWRRTEETFKNTVVNDDVLHWIVTDNISKWDIRNFLAGRRFLSRYDCKYV